MARIHSVTAARARRETVFLHVVRTSGTFEKAQEVESQLTMHKLQEVFCDRIKNRTTRVAVCTAPQLVNCEW